jgi:DNA repair exonuclease SbcCD nuclease subunit
MFIGDTHADDKNPAMRQDDYLAACVAELEECLALARKHKCDAVVHLGDVFHRMEVGGVCRNAILRSLQKYADLRKIVVVGNHDVKANLHYLPNSALGTLIDAGVLEMIDYCPDLRMAFGHFRVGIEDEIRAGALVGVPAIIWALHASVADAPQFGEYILFEDVPLSPETQLVVAGHIHHPMRQQIEGGPLFVNPGSVTRRELNIHNRDRQPQVFVVEYATDGSSLKNAMLTLKSPRPGEEIFRLDEAKARKDDIQDTKNFIQQISQMTIPSDSHDKYEVLRAAGKSKGLDDSVIARVLDALRSVNDARERPE